MASYLTTATIGEFDVKLRKADGHQVLDAIDPDLLKRAEAADRRAGSRDPASASPSTSGCCARSTSPPAARELSFWVQRDTEPNWDFFFVEAHTPGADDWTTLPDLNDHTPRSTGVRCAGLSRLHPFLAHYLTPELPTVAGPEGTTGVWRAAAAQRRRRAVGGRPHAVCRETVEVALSYASDDDLPVQRRRRRRHRRAGRPGPTSFEHDGPLDGWTSRARRAGSTPNTATGPSAPRPTRGRARPATSRGRRSRASPRSSLPRRRLRALSVLGRRRDRRRPAARLRAREPDAPDLLARVLRGSRRRRGRHRGRPRARPPVDGRLLAVAQLAAHLAQRGLRDLHRVAVERARGPRHGAGDFDGATPRSRPTTLLAPDDRRPGPTHLFDAAGLQPRRDDPARAAARIGDDAFFRLLKQWVRATPAAT